MAAETTLTITGNLTGDPELRFTPNGTAVAGFTIAATPRSYNKQTSQWDNGETLFMRCSAWRETAENIAETLEKGMRVIAQGRLESRTWKTREGENRTNLELQIDEIGPSLKYAKGKITRSQKPTNNPPTHNYQNTNPTSASSTPAVQDDPWTGAAQTTLDDEPPF